ncbi:hypothetical protein HCN44_007969 [Aphidius gifuensis]|uniref:Uncharacterized protein n=1 Tax=Aphidius gifuensis TaxID=684658 RepID=A0A834XLS3_APHGI|nr:hypothetical protein HCN44_007969 [Aphidius gifuensis]
MSSQNLTAQIECLKSVELIFDEYHEVNKRFGEMCLQENSVVLKTNKTKSIVDVEYQFKVPDVPKKRRKIVNNIDAEKMKFINMEKDLVVSRHIREHLLDESLLTQNVKYILKSPACDMIKEIFKLAQHNTKLFRQYALKLHLIISQQNKIIRHEMLSCAKKLSAKIVNLKLTKKIKFVGYLGYRKVIRSKLFEGCLNVYLLNKTEIDIQCLLKLIKGYGNTWTTTMPSEIVKKFINIVNENNYSEHTKNELKKYYTKYIQVDKEG